MTSWLLYSVAVSAVLALSALCLDHGLRNRGLPLRWVWAGALLGSVLLSVAPWVRSSSSAGPSNGAEPPTATSQVVVTRSVASEISAQPTDGRSLDRLSFPSFPRLDRPLLGVTALLAVIGMATFVGAQRRLARRRRGWRPMSVEGNPVLVSRSIGPAVVGFLEPAIVLPEWVLGMESARRRLVILHEAEHLRQRDGQLLFLAYILAVLMPWNVAIWWQLRRLRQAVELDCDRRVLHRSADAECYGELLIEMGQRSSGRKLALAAFAESTSFLERRIRSMFAPKPHAWRMAFGTCLGVSAALLLLAWETPTPRLPELTSPPVSPLSDDGRAATSELAEARVSDSPALGDVRGEISLTDVALRAVDGRSGGTENEDGVSEMTAGNNAASSAEGVVAERSAAPVARRPRVEELVQRDYPEIYTNGLGIDRAIWFAIDRNGEFVRSWIGPNLYINLGPASSPLAELDLPEGSPERATAAAEHQQREQEVLRANVPGMDIRSMYAGYFSGGGGSSVVHFVTEDPGAGNWSGRFRVASAFVADAIDAELRTKGRSALAGN